MQENNWLPQVGVFPLLELPTGSANDALGNGHLQAFLPVWLQKSWGSWTVYGGGGYGINSFSGHQNWGFFGAVLQKQVLPNVLIGAEVFHQTVYQTDFPNVGTAFNIGMVIDFNEHQHLLFSAGRSIDGPIGFQCYVAYQFTFGPEVFHSLSHWFGHQLTSHGQRLFNLLKTAAPAATLVVRLLPGLVFFAERMKKFMFPAEWGIGRFERGILLELM